MLWLLFYNLNKFCNLAYITLIALILTSGSVANAEIIIGDDGNQTLSLKYLNPTETGSINIQYVGHVDQKLEYFKTTTGICFQKQDNATDIQIGDKGVGVMFACYLPNGCDDATKLHVWFFSSVLGSLNPTTWAAGGTDFSHYNTGSLEVGNATDFDTTYKLKNIDAQNLTIPLTADETPQWKCFANFNGDEPKTRLDL